MPKNSAFIAIIVVAALLGAIAYLVIKNRSSASTQTAGGRTTVSADAPGIVKVKVIDSKGDPVKGATVSAGKLGNTKAVNGVLTAQTLKQTAITDGDGVAEIKLTKAVSLGELVRLSATASTVGLNVPTTVKVSSELTTAGPIAPVEQDLSSFSNDLIQIPNTSTIHTIVIPFKQKTTATE